MTGQRTRKGMVVGVRGEREIYSRKERLELEISVIDRDLRRNWKVAI